MGYPHKSSSLQEVEASHTQQQGQEAEKGIEQMGGEQKKDGGRSDLAGEEEE